MASQFNNKKQVLLIDDEKDLAEMLSLLLETRGYDVDVAYTAKQALRMANSDYDLIILDLILPDSHGFEICRRLKQTDTTRHIPVIILSASTVNEDRVEGLYLGADDFLAKPCDHEELFARMDAVIRRHVEHGVHGLHRTRKYNIVQELRKILHEGLIVPYFQPIYKLNDLSLYGVEILSRPSSETFLSSPQTFFKSALRYGMYTDLEVKAWSLAAEAIARVPAKDKKMFFNCNPYLIESVKLNEIEGIFSSNNIDQKNIVLEITERSEVSNFKKFYECLEDYRAHGFKFAVDDVGGGYASLESIVETRPEIVKIDKRIICGCNEDSFKQSVIRFLVALCKENNIVSVAEGIETKEDMDMAIKLGVDNGQGYFMHRPIPQLDLAKFSAIQVE